MKLPKEVLEIEFIGVCSLEFVGKIHDVKESVNDKGVDILL